MMSTLKWVMECVWTKPILVLLDLSDMAFWRVYCSQGHTLLGQQVAQDHIIRRLCFSLKLLELISQFLDPSRLDDDCPVALQNIHGNPVGSRVLFLEIVFKRKTRKTPS